MEDAERSLEARRGQDKANRAAAVDRYNRLVEIGEMSVPNVFESLIEELEGEYSVIESDMSDEPKRTYRWKLGETMRDPAIEIVLHLRSTSLIVTYGNQKPQDPLDVTVRLLNVQSGERVKEASRQTFNIHEQDFEELRSYLRDVLPRAAAELLR